MLTMRFRAEPAAYVIFSVVLLIPTALFAYGYVFEGLNVWGCWALVSAAFHLSVLLLLHSVEVVLGPDYLEYRYAFRGHRRVPFRDISALRIEWGMSGPLRLSILPTAASGQKEFHVATKLLSLEACKAILRTLSRVADVGDRDVLERFTSPSFGRWSRLPPSRR